MKELTTSLSRVIDDTFVYDSVEYKGKIYPTIVINVDKIDKDAREQNMDYLVTLADYELWKDIEDDYNHDVIDAIDMDNDIYYYCQSGFIASKPTEEKVIEYMKGVIG